MQSNFVVFIKYLQAFTWVYNVQFIYAYNKQLRFSQARDWMSSQGALLYMFSRNPFKTLGLPYLKLLNYFNYFLIVERK